MILGFRRLDAHEEPPTRAGFGQTGERPYAERQRVPGDYDAQTSIHGVCPAMPWSTWPPRTAA